MTIDKALSNTALRHDINVFIELFGEATVLKKTVIVQRFACIYFSNGRYALNM